MVPLVTLFVRTFVGERHLFASWRNSLDLFWPAEWPVVVVFDDSRADRAFAASEAAGLHVAFERAPAEATQWRSIMATSVYQNRSGYAQVQWSQFRADRVASTEFIAFTDVDAPFHAWAAQPALLEGHRPRVLGRVQHEGVFGFRSSIEALGLDYGVDFMYALPFVVRRVDLAPARDWLALRMGAATFDQAFTRWLEEVKRLEVGSGRTFVNYCPSMQNAMAYWLRAARKEAYAWHVLDAREEHGFSATETSQASVLTAHLFTAKRRLLRSAYQSLVESLVWPSLCVLRLCCDISGSSIRALGPMGVLFANDKVAATCAQLDLASWRGEFQELLWLGAQSPAPEVYAVYEREAISWWLAKNRSDAFV
ncbi:unnamed protein product, partial [Polarella glacialis]